MQARVVASSVAMTTRYFLILNFFIFFVQNGKNAKNCSKISAFNYTKMNLRNIYCRYVIFHFVSFDLM
jgi:hypothetical protein